MRTCYVFPTTRTIADLVKPGELTQFWTITRINVPELHRGNGLGTKMLKLILSDADAEGATLALQPLASDPSRLDYDKLVAWYGRYGFETDSKTGYMVRRPHARP